MLVLAKAAWSQDVIRDRLGRQVHVAPQVILMVTVTRATR